MFIYGDILRRIGRRMNTVYRSVYTCKSISPTGLPGYNDVVLGLGNSGATQITIKGTCGRFVVGKEYFIEIGEM